MSAAYIVATGSVGAGATTVAEIVIARWGAEDLLEGKIEENNPFFKDAQADPDRWAFASQAHFLAASAARHASLRELREKAAVGIVIEDRTPFEHQGAYSLANHNLGSLSTREFELLAALNREIEKQYEIPSLLIYREMTDTQLVERVSSRARDGEVADYDRLRAVHAAFEEFADAWDKSPLVRVPAGWDLKEPDGEAELVAVLTPYLGEPVR